MIVSTEPQCSGLQPPSVGTHGPTHHTGGIPVRQDGDMISDPNTPKYQAKLKLWAAYSVKNVLDILVSISSKRLS